MKEKLEDTSRQKRRENPRKNMLYLYMTSSQYHNGIDWSGFSPVKTETNLLNRSKRGFTGRYLD